MTYYEQCIAAIDLAALLLLHSPLQTISVTYNHDGHAEIIEHFGVRYKPVISKGKVMLKCNGGLTSPERLIELWSNVQLLPDEIEIV